MRKHNWERIAAGSGMAFVALSVAAFLVAPTPPDPDASQQKLILYFLDNAREVKASTILFGLALIAFTWFLGSLAAALRDRGEGRLASVAYGGGLLTAGLAFLSTVITAALVWRVAIQSPLTLRGLYDVQLLAATVIGFPAAALAYATAIASWRTKLFPQWYAPLTGLAALALVFGGAALASTGFYAPDGAYSRIVTVIVFLAWVFVTSGLLVTRLAGDEGKGASAAAA